VDDVADGSDVEQLFAIFDRSARAKLA